MPPKEFKYFLSNNAYVSVYLFTDRAKVTEFVVKLNYITITENETCEVIRFDTAHGTVHKDILLPDGSKYLVKRYRSLSHEQGLDFATDDLDEHFEFYIERFKQWQKERKKG